MRYFVLISVLFSLISIIGCGDSDLRDKVGETSGRLEKVERDLSKKMDTISSRMDNAERDLTAKIESLEKSNNSIKRTLEKLSEGEIDFGDTGDIEDEEYSEMLEELEQLKIEMKALEQEFTNVKSEIASLRTMSTPSHQTAYRDMADPAKLAEKLDTFAKEYAPKLEETGQQSEFEADMEEYKTEATSEYSTEELLEKYKASINQRMEETEDDRMKQWYERQLKALEDASDESLEARLRNYRRYENMRELSTIARKYNIPRTEFRKYGLQTYGGGWSPTRTEGGN